jgi:hypothetical protein
METKKEVGRNSRSANHVKLSGFHWMLKTRFVRICLTHYKTAERNEMAENRHNDLNTTGRTSVGLARFLGKTHTRHHHPSLDCRVPFSAFGPYEPSLGSP